MYDINVYFFYYIDVKDMVAKVINLAALDKNINADHQSSVVIICGTGYIMPDARSELGINEINNIIHI